MAKKTKYKTDPKTLRDCAPGTFVKMPIGVAGDEYYTRARVAWHWGDGSVCVRPLQLAGGSTHTTFNADTPCRLCTDYKREVPTDDIF